MKTEYSAIIMPWGNANAAFGNLETKEANDSIYSLSLGFLIKKSIQHGEDHLWKGCSAWLHLWREKSTWTSRYPRYDCKICADLHRPYMLPIERPIYGCWTFVTAEWWGVTDVRVGLSLANRLQMQANILHKVSHTHP